MLSLDPVYLRPGHDEIDLYVATVITDHLRQTRLVDDKSGSGQWVSESFRVENGKVFRQGLLQIPLRWRDPEYVARGENIKLGKDLYGYNCVVVMPQGRFSAEVTVCRKLPPGEYEAYWRMYHSIGKLAGLGPVSGRFSFDVIEEAGGDPK